MKSVGDTQNSNPFWEGVSVLNWGLAFITPTLMVEMKNRLAAELFNAADLPSAAVPLSQCLSAQTEAHRLLRDAIRTQKELHNYLLLWETGGQIRHVLLDTYSHWYPHGEFAGMYIVAKDLGDFVLAERHLQLQDRLKTVGKVAAGVAHEIRNPLTTIKGFLQIMVSNFAAYNESDVAGVSPRVYLEMMLAEIQRMEYIVTDLLMLANPRHPEKQPCDIKTLLEELLPKVHQRADKEDINISCECGDNLIVDADKEMLTHAILNIIANGVDAMADSDSGKDTRANSHHLSIRAYAEADGVNIDISDTGPGIPYYQTDKIFDTFYTTKASAIGLGLPICQKIMSAHHGDIKVSSKGFGTTFHLWLPTTVREETEG